jgi:hypothetical protein
LVYFFSHSACLVSVARPSSRMFDMSGVEINAIAEHSAGSRRSNRCDGGAWRPRVASRCCKQPSSVSAAIARESLQDSHNSPSSRVLVTHALSKGCTTAAIKQIDPSVACSGRCKIISPVIAVSSRCDQAGSDASVGVGTCRSKASGDVDGAERHRPLPSARARLLAERTSCTRPLGALVGPSTRKPLASRRSPEPSGRITPIPKLPLLSW